MTRAEHLAWCKQRALEYVDVGDIKTAIASMFLDLEKHPEIKCNGGIGLAMMMMLAGGQLSTAQQARDFINGFN